jgi:hypothetical protein
MLRDRTITDDTSADTVAHSASTASGSSAEAASR